MFSTNGMGKTLHALKGNAYMRYEQKGLAKIAK